MVWTSEAGGEGRDRLGTEMSFSECLGLSGILIWERGREGIPGE